MTLLFDRFINCIDSYFSILFNDATKSQVMGLDILFGWMCLQFLKLFFSRVILNTLKELRGEVLQILHLIYSLVKILSDVQKWVTSNRLFLRNIRGCWRFDFLDLLRIGFICESKLEVRFFIIFTLDLSHFLFELNTLSFSLLLFLTKVLFVEEFIFIRMSLALRPLDLRFRRLNIQEKRGGFASFLRAFGRSHVIVILRVLRLH